MIKPWWAPSQFEAANAGSLVKMAGNFCFNKTILQKKHLAALADFFVQINFQEKKNSGATYKKLLFTEIP